MGAGSLTCNPETSVMNIRSTTFLLILALLFTSSHAAEQTQVARGVVYHDANENGMRDVSESPLPGVYVSNGLDVVATDKMGGYELMVGDDTIIFVIKPRDWMTPIDEQNIPRFYYIHKPAGSPDEKFKFKGVKPTGPLPASIDFPLTPSADETNFSVIVMGDPQPDNIDDVSLYANDVVAELVGTDARFAIAMGDLVGDDLSLFEPINRVHAVLGIPWYSVYGNHDMNLLSPNDKYADETFERVYGPPDYAFQYGQVHFIFLDNVRWNGPQGIDPRPRNNNYGGYNGWLHEEQLTFVANYVATVPLDDRIVVCTHIPLPTLYSFTEPHMTPQFGRLLEILSSHPHTMSYSAHTHINEHYLAGPQDGYRSATGSIHLHHNVATGSGSWYRGPHDEQGFPVTTMRDGAPNGFIKANFQGNVYRERFKGSRMPADYQLAIHAPSVIPPAEAGNTIVLANVFNGNEKSTVRLRIDQEGDWIRMQQRPQTDPGYTALRDQQYACPPPGRRLLKHTAMVTPHIWEVGLPDDLAVGVHVLEVIVTDMFGQKERGTRLIELRP